MSTLTRMFAIFYIAASLILSVYIFSKMGIVKQTDTYQYSDNYRSENKYEVDNTAVLVSLGILCQGLLVGMSSLCIAHTKDRTDEIYSMLSNKDNKDEPETTDVSELSGEGISFKYVDVNGERCRECLKCGHINKIGVYITSCSKCGNRF